MSLNGKRLDYAKANGGRLSSRQWVRLCAKYGNRCLCCGARDLPLTIDHVIPLSKGGRHAASNVQPLCRPCNAAKGDTIADYREGTLTGCTA